MAGKILTFFFIALFILPFENLIAQNKNEDVNSYAVWIRKYEKGWIDSENSFWLIEMNSNSNNLDFKSAEISYLCRPEDFVAESCCTDSTYIEEQEIPDYSGSIWEPREFFDSKNALKLKKGNTTVYIVALKQENCKCSYEYINCQDPHLEKVAAIFNYEIQKMSRKEKKFFRKNRSELTHLIKK